MNSHFKAVCEEAGFAFFMQDGFAGVESLDSTAPEKLICMAFYEMKKILEQERQRSNFGDLVEQRIINSSLDRIYGKLRVAFVKNGLDPRIFETK